MLGAVVVLTTSTLNRVMVVELALPALLPGLLVALHYAVQMTRPRMGYGSDRGQRRTPWILGGMAVLATGGLGGALAVAWMGTDRWAGMALAVLSFALVGLGVSAAGTSLLVLLAKRVAEERRAAAATTVWVMMIVGFAVTAGLAGRFLDPYSPQRLVAVSAAVSLIAMAVATLALRGLEGRAVAANTAADAARPNFRAALREVWRDADARRFTVFVFVSMLAYSTQDLILEPFAGALFGFTPGESTQLAGVQHGGTLAGMLLAALAGRRVAGAALGSLRAWTIGGCLASALALLRPGAGRHVGAALAAARQRLPARAVQRRLLHRRHRLDDEPGRRRPRRPRRHAHGPVGCGAGHRLCARRAVRCRGQRPGARRCWAHRPRPMPRCSCSRR